LQRPDAEPHAEQQGGGRDQQPAPGSGGGQRGGGRRQGCERPAGAHGVDGRAERRAVGEAQRRVLDQGAGDERAQRLRDVGGQRIGLVADLGEGDLHRALAVEGAPAGQALVGDRAQRVDVAGRAGLAAAGLLG
jgi:hypothetical protein